MFISEIRAALPPLSEKEYSTAMELASLGIRLRPAARLMQIHYLRIPKRPFRTARIRGERRRAAALMGLPQVPETLGEFLNDWRPEYENYVATAQTTIPRPGTGNR